MLAKRPAPVIGKLTNSIMSGSGKTPSEFKILSPRGPINHDLDGIGLGIVAAMEKYVDDGSKTPANKLFHRRNSGRSDPIPVNSRTSNRGFIIERKNEENSLEEYTFVTGVGPDNKIFSRVYYDGEENKRRDLDRRRSPVNNPGSLFTVSPADFDDFVNYPSSDFLSSCHMCQKKLHGKDIYMYRGEKAFCSTDCRYRQIMIDEKKEKEKCSSEFASRSFEVSSFSYNNNNGGLFSHGIFAI